jgi:hypothetical protein
MPNFKLHAFVNRGKNKGELLFPHKHEDGKFIVSPTRYEKDYIRVEEEQILRWLEKGLKLRMSNPNKGISAPSLISRESVFRAVTL